jgi:type I restriction enzyme M protein
MFYTVTLPATLWFFDKGKTDTRILFIDARNIFTQVDRSHREFSAEQISNIAIISQLHRGKRHRFIALIDRYFEQGMAKLRENKPQIQEVSQQLIAVLDDGTDDGRGKEAAVDFLDLWVVLPDLESQFQSYLEKHAALGDVAVQNRAQHELSDAFTPFFYQLAWGVKAD